MNGLISVYKRPSQTPLQAVHQARRMMCDDTSVKIGYAGRLDPLAEGVLLLMIGDETKKRDLYQNFTKEYQFNVLFGLTTDTLDPMGIITKHCEIKTNINEDDIQSVTHKFIGKIVQKYPLYSSFSINGVPMYKLARENIINDEDRPSKIVEIYNIDLIEVVDIELRNFISSQTSLILDVEGDFRQEEIIENWNIMLNKLPKVLQTAKFIVSAASGTYVRVLAEHIATKLGTVGIAYEIKRNRVGEFNIGDTLKI